MSNPGYESPRMAPDARLTPRSLAAGFVLALLLCGINSYLTLSFGVIEEGPTIAALFFFACFFLSKTKISSTELVIVATMGSAGGSLGFISNFFAAKVMATQEPYTLFEMAGFATVTSLVGLAFVIPLRDLLILKDNLPWPGSRATAAVIEALTSPTADRRQPAYLFAFTALMILFVVGNSDGGFGWWPDATALGALAAVGGHIAWAPFAFGCGYLMGVRACFGFLTGAVILMILAPSLPVPEAPARYIWPGMGFLIASGLTSLALKWRVVASALGSLFTLGAKTDDDDPILSGRGFLLFAAVAIVITAVFSVLVLGLDLIIVLVLVVIGGLLQNVIATRAAAQTAFNPARVMGVLLQGATAAVGGTSASVNLAGAGFVAGSGAQAGVLTGDLVYGRWLKVPARWQFWTQAATVVPCSIVAAYVFQGIMASKKVALESNDLAAPVAKMWATTALIFDGRSPMPPFATEAMLIGAGIGVVYVLIETALAEKRAIMFLPHSIGVGLGLVLSVPLSLSFFLGGLLFTLLLGRTLKVPELTLTTIAVACIVGEGIGGVAKPLLAMAGVL